jgi:hypothetical protein
MRANADEERRHRDAEAARRAEEQADRDRAVRDQLVALSRITDATRDAARAQLQPIVFAHAHGAARRGPNDELDLSEGRVAFPYYLSNEGTGPALNIKHGVEVGGIDYPFGGGMEFRTARAGEFLPPLDEGTTQPVPSRSLTVDVADHELPEGWRTLTHSYWARYENVFGEKFETRNPNDPRQSAVFRRITGSLPSP